jgi:two-component system, OmpR family, phosphate regulon sensor histidine kinase PhoR
MSAHRNPKTIITAAPTTVKALITEALISSLHEGVAVFDTQKQILLANPAIIKITGLSQEKFYVEDIAALFEEQRLHIKEQLEEAMISGKTTFVEEAPLQKSFYEILIVPVKTSKGVIVGGAIILHDITHRIQVAQMETEFISTASHQLRTPMTAIKWVVERFRKKEKLTKRGKEYLDNIHTSVRRLTALVDLLLNVSRIEGGRVGISPQPVELVEFIEGYLKECRPLADKKELKITFTEHPKELSARTDASALRNIIQSLISNAIEYTRSKGEITITLKTDAKKKRFLLTVKDTGIGIPKNEQENIFDKFTRGSNAKIIKTDGTGLGLHIAKKAAKLLDGEIKLKSEENKGTTFFVKLPIESKEREGTKSLM